VGNLGLPAHEPEVTAVILCNVLDCDVFDCRESVLQFMRIVARLFAGIVVKAYQVTAPW